MKCNQPVLLNSPSSIKGSKKKQNKHKNRNKEYNIIIQTTREYSVQGVQRDFQK